MTEEIKYYLNINDENVGPLSFAEITDRLKNGLLSSDDQIFKTNNAVWTPVKDLPELSEYIAKISPEEKKVWFIRKNKENIGPLSKNEVLNLLFNAQVDNNDYVWRKGLGNWMQMKDLYELRPTKDTAEKIEADGKKTLEEMPKQPKEEKEEIVPADESSTKQDEKEKTNTKLIPGAHITEEQLEVSARKKEKMQLPTLGPLELIEKKLPEEIMKEQLPPTESPNVEDKPQTPNMDKEVKTNPGIVLTKEEKLSTLQNIPTKTQKKLIPEFILGITLTLLGGYQTNNSLVMGSSVAVVGIIMVTAYMVVNRKKGTKNATDK